MDARSALTVTFRAFQNSLCRSVIGFPACRSGFWNTRNEGWTACPTQTVGRSTCRGTPTVASKEGWRCISKLLQQGLCLNHVGGLQPLRYAAVDGGQRRASLGSVILFPQQTGKTGGGTQLPGNGFLPARDLN